MDSGELIRALSVFAEPPGPEHARLAETLGFSRPPQTSTYADIFLFQLYPYASVHLGAEGWMGGDARDRVAGFWRAVGRVPPPEPDHLTALLGLLVSLGEEASTADRAATALLDESRRALLREHLAPWVFEYLGLVVALGVEPYRSWATVLGDVLTQEALSAGPARALPVHLREAPPLADPRAGDARAFLGGLLAPVVSGATVTRSELARLARELGLGLRAGERRYALENLLAQAPVGVLRGLGGTFAHAAARHEAREGLLGVSASFLRDRAETTAKLLGELATEGADALVSASEGVA